jgi:hypothetical protein
MSVLSAESLMRLRLRRFMPMACGDHAVAGWVVMRDQPKPRSFIARLVTDAPTSYVLWADNLAGIQAQLPSVWCA